MAAPCAAERWARPCKVVERPLRLDRIGQYVRAVCCSAPWSSEAGCVRVRWTRRGRVASMSDISPCPARVALPSDTHLHAPSYDIGTRPPRASTTDIKYCIARDEATDRPRRLCVIVSTRSFGLEWTAAIPQPGFSPPLDPSVPVSLSPCGLITRREFILMLQDAGLIGVLEWLTRSCNCVAILRNKESS